MTPAPRLIPLLGRFACLTLALAFMACGGGAPADQAGPGEDVLEAAPQTEPPPDCDRIAAGYIPCLPGEPALTPEVPVTAPEPWAALPCTREPGPALTVELFTDGHSPVDVALLTELAAYEREHPGGLCLRLHAFVDPEVPDATIAWFGRLRTLTMYAEPVGGSPAVGGATTNAWDIVREYLEGRRYLRAFAPPLEGPPEPPEPGLVADLAAATARGRTFGVRAPGLFLLDGRTVTDGLTFSAARSRPVLPAPTSAEPPRPATVLPWTDGAADPGARLREFTLLCRTRQDWRHRLTVISDCLKEKRPCPGLLECISGRLYDQDWSESEVVEAPPDPPPSMVVMGDGPVRLFAWLDPDCPYSRETFPVLLARVVRDPRLRLQVELVANTPRASRLRELLLHPDVAGTPGGAACVLAGILAHYPLLRDEELVRMPLGCGIWAPALQGDPKTQKLPAGQLPAFCATGLTPCLLLGTHLIEGVPSPKYLDYAISRTQREQAASKP